MIRMLKTAGLCLLLLTALSPLNAIFAQGKQVTGTVTSSENKQPVASATVTVKGTRNAVTTDAQGNYKITVDSKATSLVFSSASFISFETGINGRSVIDVELVAEVRALDDVVVVGYSTVRRKDLTGSVSSVNSKQLKDSRFHLTTILNDANVKARWLALSQREPTEKNPQRTLLEKHLTQYTTRNTADYFIHKDLGRFLRNELDFYIKNEVMNLDDVQHAEKFADIEKNLRLIQTLRAIALDLIVFLAQLEDFQKKLWLKKKFVVATHYCITLDRVPETLYPIIAANARQWEQWDKLGMLSENKTDLFGQAKTGSVEYLKAHPYLMMDTALYDAEFKQALLSAVDNLDDSLDGLLIHGDNFQALNLLQERYREQVKCVYIHPPYNTGGDGFA